MHGRSSLKVITRIFCTLLLLRTSSAVKATPSDVYVADLAQFGGIQIVNSVSTFRSDSEFSVFGLAFDQAGALYVSAYADGRIEKIDRTGISVFSFGYSHPTGLAFDSSGYLYVAEQDTGNVYRVSPDGKRKDTFGIGLVAPMAVAVDHDGNVYVSDYSLNIVARFPPTGGTGEVYVSELNHPVGLCFDLDGNLLVANQGTSQIFKIASDGSKQATASPSSAPAPTGLAVDSSYVYVSDAYQQVLAAIPRPGAPAIPDVHFAGKGPQPELIAIRPAVQLLNISTRGLVQPGDLALIGGFIVSGDSSANASANVVVRAIGPSLASAGVGNALADPTLEIHDSSGAIIGTNDNWKDLQQAQIQATGLAPTDDREAAINLQLAPGAYTAVVRGKNDTSGTALVEVYRLP